MRGSASVLHQLHYAAPWEAGKCTKGWRTARQRGGKQDDFVTPDGQKWNKMHGTGSQGQTSTCYMQFRAPFQLTACLWTMGGKLSTTGRTCKLHRSGDGFWSPRPGGMKWHCYTLSLHKTKFRYLHYKFVICHYRVCYTQVSCFCGVDFIKLKFSIFDKWQLHEIIRIWTMSTRHKLCCWLT